MELLLLARELWRRRALIVAGAVVAVALGWALSRGAPTEFGTATARIALDTPSSQLLDAYSKHSEGLAWRAAFLGDLASTRPVTERIANEMGIEPKDLVVAAPYLSVPVVPSALPERASEVAAPTSAPEPYVLLIQGKDGLPIITLEASAPDRRSAARLVTSAIAALTATIDDPNGPAAARVLVERVSPIRTKERVIGPDRMKPLGAVGVLFALWCAGVAIFGRLKRERRARGRGPQTTPALADR